MSSAGHIFDMIARMKNNRIKHDERRNRQRKVMESISGKKHFYDNLGYKTQASQNNEHALSHIYQEMEAKNRKVLLIQISVIVLVAFAIIFWVIQLISENNL